MNILVCVKQVPDTLEVKLGADFTLQRDFVAQVMNPADESALELGLALRDAYGGAVTVLTMGPQRAEGMLREALSRGADKAMLLTDPAFAGADTLATARALKAAGDALGGFDITLCGRRAADGETGQVGPMLASLWDVACVTNVTDVRVTGELGNVSSAGNVNSTDCISNVDNVNSTGNANSTGNVNSTGDANSTGNVNSTGNANSADCKNNVDNASGVGNANASVTEHDGASPWTLTIDQLTEDGTQVWQCQTPAVVTLCEWSHRLRLPTLAGLRRAANAEIPRLHPAELGLSPALCGLKGSPTRVIRVCAKDTGLRACEKLTVEALLARGVLL